MKEEHFHNTSIVRFDTQQLPQVIAIRMAPLAQELNNSHISMVNLKRLLSRGISDEAHELRQYAWKVVLGYLPLQKDKWNHAVQHQKDLYSKFLCEFLGEQEYTGWPLAMNRHHSQWQKHQKNFALWEQIEKDTCRTQAQLALFSRPAPPILLPFLTTTRREKHKHINGQKVDASQQHQTYYYDYLTRILFIFAKLHPRVSYVQGMNELVAPIFYLLNGANSSGLIQEAACFFMFNNIMSDVVELHMVDYHSHQNGIHTRLQHISNMLLAIEPSIWHKLSRMKIQPVFYAFRWITLLFSQEFPLHDTFRIWESILGSSHSRVSYTNFIVIALLVASKQVIEEEDYSKTMSFFKNISVHVKVTTAIDIADKLVELHQGSNFRQIASINNPQQHIRNTAPVAPSLKKRFTSFLKKILG